MLLSDYGIVEVQNVSFLLLSGVCVFYSVFECIYTTLLTSSFNINTEILYGINN